MWDSKNKLLSLTEGSTSTSYTYNPDGIRTGKTANGVNTHYIVDSNRDYAQVLEEVENNLTRVQYTYGHDLINQQRNNETSFYHYDGLGSTRGLSNSEGTFTDSYHYEAFGEIQNQTGSTENDYLFTGEQFDEGLNQYYLRARYYDQNIGRFTQMDTWQGNNSDPITLHKYLYANANPANYTDPTGNFSLGQMMSAVNVMANLVGTATSVYDGFQLATGQEEFSAKQLGLSILLSRMPGSSFAKNIVAKFKAKTGKNLKIPCMRNSFTEGTLIHTQSGLIPIEEVKIGDYVVSFNEKTGKQEYQAVIHLIQNEAEYELVNVKTQSGESFVSTLEHPFYINGEWKAAEDIVESDWLTTLEGISPISQPERIKLKRKVYNFSVVNTHNYYVGKEGILVHNTSSDCVISVRNMDEFFELPFGNALKGLSSRTGKNVKGAQIFKVTKKDSGLRKGDHYYLDTLHGDHLEVFDKNGRFLKVLNLDGTENAAKTAAGAGRSIKEYL